MDLREVKEREPRKIYSKEFEDLVIAQARFPGVELPRFSGQFNY